MVSLSKVRRPGSLGSLLCLCCLTQACLLLPVSCTSVIPRHPWPPWEQDTTFSDLSFLTGDSLAQAHLSLQSTILITGTSPQKEESRCALPSSSPKQTWQRRAFGTTGPGFKSSKTVSLPEHLFPHLGRGATAMLTPKFAARVKYYA